MDVKLLFIFDLVCNLMQNFCFEVEECLCCSFVFIVLVEVEDIKFDDKDVDVKIKEVKKEFFVDVKIDFECLCQVVMDDLMQDCLMGWFEEYSIFIEKVLVVDDSEFLVKKKFVVKKIVVNSKFKVDVKD